MAENDKFETLGDAYAKYPQSTLVMRKQYVDEKDARIAQLEDDNALLKRNNENLRIDIKQITTANQSGTHIHDNSQEHSFVLQDEKGTLDK